MKRIYKSFLLRLARILFTTVAICSVLMSLTFKMQFQFREAVMSFIVAAIFAGLACLLSMIIQKKDPELVAEVARILYPSASLLSLGISIVMGSLLVQEIESTGKQHLILILAGLCIMVALAIRCFDIKFLRDEAELPKRLRDF